MWNSLFVLPDTDTLCFFWNIFEIEQVRNVDIKLQILSPKFFYSNDIDTSICFNCNFATLILTQTLHITPSQIIFSSIFNNLKEIDHFLEKLM